MKLDYASAQRAFWDTAPDKPGFKAIYAAMFSGILYLLEDAGTRSITINYNKVNGLTKLGEDAYSAGLTWLDENNYWQYVKGTGRHNPALVYINVAELPEPKPTNNPPFLQPDISAGTGVGNGGGSTVVAQVVRGAVTSTVTGVVDPSHAGAFLDNQKSLPAGQACSFVKPKNIELTDEEEAMLLQAYGAEKLTLMLVKVSLVKAKKGLRESDYYNCLSWAAQQVDEDRAKHGQPKPLHKPITASQDNRAHKPFRELT